ncbi:SH3 domain-containing protein [Maridesulfovibrio ferrireducens]|uniref:SH3 domain-containing protein n=1 Tax=Maridesulfovibrio ferrireducens TaxID=246191 RepID=A0A1G9GUE4_9BACT|nr:SH3 domain-containing protein [Maridesulfovibrio ferrireducens]SDL04224.1 SH3 domain-containing protein [Maridesulfovibrio ferrireducens]
MCLKILTSMIISFSLICSGCIPQQKPSPQNSIQSQTATQTVIITPIVTGTAVLKSNVREKAASESPVVDILPKGTQVELIGKQKNWYRVKRTDNSKSPGYVFHKLINLDFENYLGTRGRNKEAVSIHNSPSTHSKTALELAPNTEFDILGVENNFYKIRGDYFEGFVIAELCVADPENPIAKTETISRSSSTGTKSKTIYSTTSTTQKKPTTTYNSSPHPKKTTKRTTQSSNNALNLFGAFAAALTGTAPDRRTSTQVKSEDDALKEILKSVSTSKELAKKTVEIREQMLRALNETRALQSLVGATVSTMNQNYKTAIDTAQGVCSTGMEKISIKAFINDLSYEPTNSIEGASVKIAENAKMLSSLERQIKVEADSFSKLNASQIQNMDSIIKSFSNNLHASNAMYDFSIDKSGNVILGIDRAVNAYEEKSGPLTVEATKQIGILTISGTQLVAQISNAQSNPVQALTVLPRMMEIQEELSDLTTLLSDFKNDYDYIEKNSALIAKQGADISRIIMTARRKNTQITTTLESYYEKKLALSKRLKDSYSRQTQEGFKMVEKKADSVALAEDLLD